MARHRKQRTVGDGPRSLRRGNGAQAPLMGAESWGGGGWGQTARDEQSGGVVPSRQPTGAHDAGDDKRRPSHGTNANGSTATGRVCSMRGRRGWAGGGVGAQRMRSADPAMGRYGGTQFNGVRVCSLRGRHRQTGLTLSELLTTLIVAALLAGAAIPAMSALTTRAKADAALEQMSRAIQFTRYQAITHRTNATLCPGREAVCGRRDSWHEGAMVFLDANANGVRDAGEEILQRLPPLESLRVRWRSFRNRKSLSMRPDGTTDWQPGNMVVCPTDGDARQARQLIVNAQGRVRFSRDEDGVGIVEDARGRPVSC